MEATHPTRRSRRRKSLVLVLGVLISGSATTATSQVVFEQQEIITGSAQSQTILTGFLLGGAIADLAAVDVDEETGRSLNIYSFVDGSWVPIVNAPLRPDVQFVDVTNISGHDRLITYEPGRINWFDPEAASERELVAGDFDVEPPPRAFVPHVDITRDVNGDDRDDLIVPGTDGSWVLIQIAGGRFAKPVRIAPTVSMDRIYETGGYRFSPWDMGRIHAMDYDQDGRSDLVVWNDDHFEVHLQDERGLFGTVTKTFTTDVAFDSDDPFSLAGPHGFRRRRKDHMPTGAMTGSVLRSLTDLNGDGVADLVVFSLEIASMWSAHSTYEVHLGMPTPSGGTVFVPDVDTAVPAGGVPFEVLRHDFDHDGEVDVMFCTIKVGPLKTIGMIGSGILTRSLPLELEFYRMEGGTYSDRPTASRRVRTVSLGKSGERAALKPSVLIGDVDGDNRSDLLVQKGRKELRVFLGVPGPELFVRRPQKVAVGMPNEEYTWLVDLNKDGRQDILMHHPSTAEAHRVTALISH